VKIQPKLAGALAALLFFAGLLAVGVFIYRDYGLSWDEPTQVEMGLKHYRYVMRGDPALLEWRDRSYGPFFEIVLVILQVRAPEREMYFSRHLLTFLAFWAGLGAFFFLARRLAGGTALALLGCALLALHPRLFADAFYNSKDIPFLALYAAALLTLVVLLDRPGWPALGAHALFSAALIATRLPGLFAAALTVALLVFESAAGRLAWRRALGLSAAYLALTGGLVILFWPTLWHDPWGEGRAAFEMMAHFPHETAMRYLGETISSLDLPWH
jgi:hypothetical protein